MRHSQNTRKQNHVEMKLPAWRERDRLYQRNRNDKHKYITDEREPGIHSIHQAPRQTSVIHRPQLPRVGPQSGDGSAVEDDKAHLGNVCGDE